MKYYFKLIFLLLPVIQNLSSAQILPGSAYIACGKSILASNSIWTFYTNPAGFIDNSKITAAFYYSPSPFGMKELRNEYAAFSYNFDFGRISLGFSNYGFELFRQNYFHLNYSSFISKLHLGGALTLRRISIERYGHSYRLNANVGFTYQLNNMNVSLSVLNLLRNKNNNLDYDPIILQLGANYNLPFKSKIYFSIYKEEVFPVSFRAGIQYTLLNLLNIRTGFNSYPEEYSGGLGIKYKMFKLNFAASFHNVLGVTSQFDLTISLK